jgi:lipopolysaccharide export system permease protein
MMKDVFIEDRRNPKAISTIIAPEGVVMKDAEGRSARLRLFNGMINQVAREKRSANTIYFTTYDLNLNLAQMANLGRYIPKDEDEMTLGELKAYIRNVRKFPQEYFDALIEFHQKFSVPAACLALGILAIPLGVELKSTRRSAGLGMGMFIFILYYVLMTAGRVFGEMGIVRPAVGLWTPNILVGIGGTVMLVRTANEKPNYLAAWLRYLGGKLRHFTLRVALRLGWKDYKTR